MFCQVFFSRAWVMVKNEQVLYHYRKLVPAEISGAGKSLELEQPQYFVDGRGTLQAKKGR